jgi:hypothetical protein
MEETMHNIDRTQSESPWGEYEYEYQGEANAAYGSYGEFEYESSLDEAELMEFADELLSVSNEMEMDLFLGDLFKKVSKSLGHVGRAASGFLRSPAAKMLAKSIKGIAGQALPMLAQAAGPAAGAALSATGFGAPLAPLASALAPGAVSAIGNMLGLELEGLSGEDQEFNIASQLVKLAEDATRKVVSAGPGAAPQQAVQQALTSAAQKYAPGLLSAGQMGLGMNQPHPATHRCPRCGFVHAR